MIIFFPVLGGFDPEPLAGYGIAKKGLDISLQIYQMNEVALVL